MTLKHVSGCLGGVLLGLFAWTSARAVLPEPGMYWSVNEPGKGYYFDYQAGLVFLSIYAYERASGEPTFYIASGPVRDDAEEPGGLGAPAYSQVGYYPLHWAPMDLYRVRGGSCVVCAHRTFDPPERIGIVNAYFVGSNFVLLDIFLVTGGQTSVPLERFAFGYDVPVVNSFGQGLVNDLRGEWVFVDRVDATAAPMRFDFTQRSVAAADAPPVDGNFVLATFRDPVRNAEIRCIRPDRTGIPENEFSTRLKTDGCELSVAGSVRMSFLFDDLGIDRIHAFRGALPLLGDAYRGTQPLLGFRVE